MARSAKADVNMQERLNEFDPGGALPAACSAIFALFDDKGDAITAAFYDSYLSHTQLDRKLAPQALEALQAEILRYQRLKYNEIRSEEWADSARACVTHARRHNISVRTVLVAMAAANEVALDAIWSAPDVDPVQRRALAQAMLRLSMIEAELISMALGEALAREEAIEREHSGQLFEQRIVGEIDSASRLGEGLREQAKDASAATRGMLGKASEVAAAAEQSALAMREAAHTSAGLIRAIEDARAEVEGTADVAARASVQAGEAVTMSSTLSDHAKSIESILGLIRDIAGQTNLLALNATIEAARAGEAGKGFAVVAGEVKGLAAQTARATEEITAQIGQMQTATTEAVAAIQGIGSTVERTSEIATAIAAAVEQQGSTTREIARSAAQMAEGSGMVADAIGQVQGAAEQTGAAAAQIMAASGDLSERAASLRAQAGSFLGAIRAA